MYIEMHGLLRSDLDDANFFWLDTETYRVGRLAFSYTCTAHVPLGDSMALNHACIVECKFTPCAGSIVFRVEIETVAWDL